MNVGADIPKEAYLVVFRNPKGKRKHINRMYRNKWKAQEVADYVNSGEGDTHGAHVRKYKLIPIKDDE